jgi:hypothetical protein
MARTRCRNACRSAGDIRLTGVPINAKIGALMNDGDERMGVVFSNLFSSEFICNIPNVVLENERVGAGEWTHGLD